MGRNITIPYNVAVFAPSHDRGIWRISDTLPNDENEPDFQRLEEYMSKAATPKHLWIVGIIALLWNLMGP